MAAMDDGIDDETVDLFAAMNSAVLELQIEMDLLESKEYQNDNGNEIDRIKDNANDHSTIQESSSSPPPSPMHQILDTEEEDRDDSVSQIPRINPITPPSNVDKGKTEPTSIVWQKMEHAQVGDDDYTPVLDFSQKAVKSFESVKVGDDDYSTDSDYTSESSSADSIVVLEPAKVGDEDYSPVMDFTSPSEEVVATTAPKQRRSKRTKVGDFTSTSKVVVATTKPKKKRRKRTNKHKTYAWSHCTND